MAQEETDVLIVGGGPVGLFMANDLAHRGVRSVVVEKRLTTSNSAKAVFVNTRSMEHMRQLGLEKKFQKGSYPRDLPMYLCICTSVLDGKVIFEEKSLSWGDVVDGKEGKAFPAFNLDDSMSPSLLCPQFAQEPLLKESLDSTQEGSIMWGWEAIALSQDEQGVTLKAKNMSGEEKVLRAKYVLGCDGGKSWVRKYMNIHTYGKFVVQRACSITFKSPEFLARVKEEDRMGFYLLLSQNAVGVMIALNNEGMFAFHCICPPNTTDEELDERCHNAADYVHAAIGRSDIPITIVDASPYNMHALISTKFRHGRVLLVGDAAHQWLPVGGLGLNTGFGDAANIGWKLAGVLQGWAGEHLLDSYELERPPIADDCRRLALVPVGTPMFTTPSIIASLMSLPGIRYCINKVFGRIIPMQLDIAGEVILGFQYSQSNIICYEVGHSASSGNVRPNSSSLPGYRAPHVALSECPTILDLFGKSFVLLIIGGEETDCEHLQEGMKERGVPFEVRAFPRLPELVQRYNCKYYLVRPDGIVSWRADYQPSALEVERSIVPILCGDVLHPRPPKPAPPPPKPSFSFLANVGVGMAAATLLCTRNHRKTLFRDVVVYGLAAATLLSYFRGERKAGPFLQQVSRHSAWLTTQFGHAASVLKHERRFVSSFGPNDVVIRVHAASINPIDTVVRQGYASSILRAQASLSGHSLFPFVLGRDCSGEVVAVGDEVREFFPGDKVYAAVSITLNGTHAEFVCLDEEDVSPKPCNVDHREAASLPWVAVTVWTALVHHAGLTPGNAQGKRVLVHAGSGGVGSFAIQLLKAWGAHVTTTCSKNNIAFVHSLGADTAFDYTSGPLSSALTKYSFDVVLDPIGRYEQSSLSLLKLYDGAHYVSLKSPQGSFTARLGGFLGGFIHQWFYRYKIVSNRIFGGRGFHYSAAQPSGATLRVVKDLVEKGAVKPILEAVYSMEEMVAAHLHVEGGHTRGKVVVSMTEER